MHAIKSYTILIMINFMSSFDSFCYVCDVSFSRSLHIDPFVSKSIIISEIITNHIDWMYHVFTEDFYESSINGHNS